MDNGRVSRDGASSYLRYLPAIYQQDAFIGRFLRIFEDIVSPIQGVANTLPERFDPRLAPPPMLEFLASWVDAPRPARLPEERWRQLTRLTVWLHRWRGTKRGLRVALEAASGRRPLISEYASGLVLGPDASLGVNTTLQGGMAPHISVTFNCPPQEIDTALINDIIRDYKPAHVSHSVAFQPASE